MSGAELFWVANHDILDGTTRTLHGEIIEVDFKNPGKRKVIKIQGRPRRYYLEKDGCLHEYDAEHELEAKMKEFIVFARKTP